MRYGMILGDLVSPAANGVKTLVPAAIGAAVLLGVIAFLRKRKRDSNTKK